MENLSHEKDHPAVFIVLGCNRCHFSDCFMVPDGQKDTLLQYREVLPGDPQYNTMQERFSRKPFTDLAELYRDVQNYLAGQGKQDTVAPVYLALTDNQGGFPRAGIRAEKSGEGNDSSALKLITSTCTGIS